MRIGVAAAMALLLLGVVGGASAQTPQERVAAAIARARDAGIPIVLLENKIAEGRAKGIPMERIAAAIERRGAALERASQALQGRPDVDAADLTVAADAMESGVSEAVLQALAEAAPRERRVVAIAALTQLVELGHVPQVALDRVREALKRGPEALLNLPAQAAAGNRPSVPPGRPDGAGAGGGAQAGPPAGIPAPGRPPQVTIPATPANPRRPPTSPGSGAGS